MLKPRRPTEQEVNELVADFAQGLSSGVKSRGAEARRLAREMISRAAVAVFDGYSTGPYPPKSKNNPLTILENGATKRGWDEE